MPALPKSPFAASTSAPGKGEIVLEILPPQRPVLTTVNYQYPLKLVAPKSHTSPDGGHPVNVVFLLTYGGGLVGGDKISLSVTLTPASRLVLVTQGSTKIFKSPSREIVSRQGLDVKIAAHAALCYLPDPTQPFGESVYEQKQIFHLDPGGTSSLCVLDWVTEGRKARGESWSLWRWQGRNEVREFSEASKAPGRLLLRDSLIMTDDAFGHVTGLNAKADNLGVFGTLILSGNLFESLASYFMDEFNKTPRIGAKNWTTMENKSNSIEDTERSQRQHQERADGVLWTAANVRGFGLVKFGAREVEGARRWLNSMISREGSVEKHFGEQALFCVR